MKDRSPKLAEAAPWLGGARCEGLPPVLPGDLPPWLPGLAKGWLLAPTVLSWPTHNMRGRVAALMSTTSVSTPVWHGLGTVSERSRLYWQRAGFARFVLHGRRGTLARSGADFVAGAAPSNGQVQNSRHPPRFRKVRYGGRERKRKRDREKENEREKERARKRIKREKKEKEKEKEKEQEKEK